MKKRFLLGVIVLAGTAAMASDIPRAESTTTTTLTAWVRDYPLAQASPYKSAAARFEKLHPGVKINLLGFGGDTLHQKILLSKAGGPKADIMQSDTIWLGQLAQQHIISNLDAYYAHWSGKSDYSPRFLASSQWQGHYYGVWLNTDVRVLLWNKDVFKKAGLDPARPPRTWNDVVTMAKHIMSRVPRTWGVGFSAFTNDDTSDFWYPLLWMNGGEILNRTWTKAAFNSPAGVRALQFYVDLVNKYKVTPKDVLTQSSADVEQGVDSGKYAMMLAQAGGGFGDFKDASALDVFTKRFGDALIPVCSGCRPATGSGGWLLTINSASTHKDLAFQFISMVTDGQNALPFDVAQAVMPVRQSIFAKYTHGVPGYPYFAVAAASYRVTHFRPPVPQYPQIAEQVATAIQKAVAGQATAKAALDAAAANVNKLLARR